METAFFSAASLFHADDDDSDDDGGTRDEAQVGAEGENQQPALEYEERIHKFPGVDLSIREFSSHQLNANLLWPGTFFFADWLVKNPSILDGQRILELGSGTGALAIFLITTLSFLLKESDLNGQKGVCTNITTKAGTQVAARCPMFLMSWRRRIGKDQSIFFDGCEKAGLEVQHLGDLVYLISKKR